MTRAWQRAASRASEADFLAKAVRLRTAGVSEFTPDVVLKLRELRHFRELSQKDVARLSGVGEKTISSFETGQRIESLKLAQLRRILDVYGLTEKDFFDDDFESVLSAAPGAPHSRSVDWFAEQIIRLIRVAQRSGHHASGVMSKVVALLAERSGL